MVKRTMERDVARRKKRELAARLNDLGSVLVAFSGGVDSSFLLAVAHDTLGERAVAATAVSVIHPDREIEEAEKFAVMRHINHVVFHSGEMQLPEFVNNGADRCYHCKRRMFRSLLDIAGELEIQHVAHGATMDDLKDYRPGFEASRELNVVAPLIDVQIYKAEVRFLSREMTLPTWDRPAFSCLATRIPYGSAITERKLKMIDEAEQFLMMLGLKNVRVRHYGTVARLEVDKGDIGKVLHEGLRMAIVDRFRELGFEHTALDLEGYMPGKMNREIDT